MGRPIKKKFFGNITSPYQNQATGGATGIGGEGISSTISVVNTGSDYSLGSVAVFSNPSLPGGTVATGDLTISAPGAGGITAVTLTSAGSGYTGTATITITTASGVTKVSTGTNGETTISVANTSGIFVGMTVTGDTGLGASNAPKVTAIGTNEVTVSDAHDNTFTGVTLTFADLGTGFSAETVLTSVTQNALEVYAFVEGGSSGLIADILKQEASKRYLVKTSEGTSQCKLVAVATGSLTEGQMNLIATDSLGSTYYVTKLTSRKALLTRRTDGGSGYEFATNARSGWTLGSATTGVVSIASVA